MARIGEDEDVWGLILYEASWGGLRLDVLETDDAGGRTLARHRYAHRDGADVEDMGGEERVTRCSLIFFERPTLPGEEGTTHYERFRRFEAMKREGKARTFVHPLTGSYKAKIGEFSWRAAAGQRDTILATVEFVEDTAEPAVFATGAGAPIGAGAAEVDAAAAEVDAEGYLVIDPSEVEPIYRSTRAAKAEAAAWEKGDLTSRDVSLGLIKLGNDIDEIVATYNLATDVTRYPLFVAYSKLRYALIKAANAFTERTPRLTTIEVRAAAPLLVIAARFYGAAEADARAAELARLNVIKNPARIEAGTILKAQTRTTDVRLRSPV